jgi:hypothetical protein
MTEEMRTIAREREEASARFDVRELTHSIYGGPQATALKVLPLFPFILLFKCN